MNSRKFATDIVLEGGTEAVQNISPVNYQFVKKLVKIINY